MDRLRKVALVAASCVLGLTMARVPAMAQVTTTTIADTVYRADGTYAAGSLLISWPAFTTASNLAVPAGKTTVQIGTNGAVSFPLAPNAGSTPAGTYYTVVYQLNDGTVSTEYWAVPPTSETTIASVRSQVLPASIAVQSATVSYVNNAVAGYLPLSGGVLAGPLDLSEDPTGGAEAATKHYVDASASSVSSGFTSKVDFSPSGNQSIVQPPGTTLSVSSLANIQYAAPHQTGAGNNGISNTFASTACAGGGCMVVADPGYSTTEQPQGHPFPNCSLGGEGGQDFSSYCAYKWPFNSRLWDQRGGTDVFSYQDPLNQFDAPAPGVPLTQVGLGNSGLARLYTYDYVADRGGSQIIPEVHLLHSFAGGHNGEGGYTKSNYAVYTNAAAFFSRGQHQLGANVSFCLGLGDCLGAPTRIYYSVGLSRGGDEGIHKGDSSLGESPTVFHGAIASGAGVGSTSLKVTPADTSNGDQGEGRFLIDLTHASAGNLGTVTGTGQAAVGNGQITGWVSNAGNTAPPQMIAPSGTFTPSTLVATATSAVTATAQVVGTQTVTLTVTSGTPAMGSPICISDYDNFEIATVTAVSPSTPSVTATFIRTHYAGALVTQGGTCGWFAAMNSETIAAGAGITVSKSRYVMPLIGSPDSAHSYYWYSIGGAYGALNGGGTNVLQGTAVAWNYLSGTGQSASCNAACLAGTGPIAVTTTCSGCTFSDHNTPGMIGSAGNLAGQVVTISGASDTTYNGSYTFGPTAGPGLAMITGQNTFTYTPLSTPTSGSQSVGLTSCNCTFTMYPGAEVLGVFNTTTQMVDGALTLAANAVNWGTGDQVEEPHWHLPYVADFHDVIAPIVPMVTLPWGRGWSYRGTVTGNLHGFQLNNNAPNNLYYGLGGTHNPPARAISVGGYWETLFGAGAPSASVFALSCKPDSLLGGDGCTKWDADYSLFTLANHGGPGGDWIYFYPQSDTLFESFGGVKLYVGSDVTDTAQNISPTTGSPGLGLSGTVYATGLWVGAQSGWGAAAPITGTLGTGSNLLTDNGASIASGKTLTVAGTLNVTGTFAVPHVATTGGATAPGIAAGTGAGTSPTVTLSNARDTDGTINVTTGTAPGASAVVATVTFGVAYAGTPNCQVTPASASAMNTVYSPPAASTNFTVKTGATALAASTSYTYTYHCLQ